MASARNTTHGKPQQQDAAPAFNHTDQPLVPANGNGLANGAQAQDRLPEPVARRGIDEATWRTLCNSVFPGALPESILMAVDYCKARKLDILKKPCHIVPMQVKVKKKTPDGRIVENDVFRDVILPGIYEYRITARRTGEYMGHDEPVFGPSIQFGPTWSNGESPITAPEYCKYTVYRWNPTLKEKIPYTVIVYFSEVVATTRDGAANARWRKAPRQMLTKTAEAAALREAFPDELGGEYTVEEMQDRVLDGHAADMGRPKLTAPRALPSQEPEHTDGEVIDDGDVPDSAPSESGGVLASNGIVLVTPEQIAQIRETLSDYEIVEEDFLRHKKLSCLDEIEFDDFPRVIAEITGKQAE